MRFPASDDQPFQHYTAKHRIVAWISQNLFDSVTYTVRRGLNKGMRRKGGLAWLPEFLAPADPTPEYLFWANLSLRDLVIYDVGAFHGLLALFFARQAKQVICYEPNSLNHAHLTENLRLNGIQNVLVRKLGVGAKPETAMMVTSSLMPGGASIERETAEGLLRSKQELVSEEIQVTSLDQDIRDHALPTPDFVKIDIEGAELAALTGARETLLAYHPQLFLEMHGETMNLKRKNVAAIVDCLHDLDYLDIRHVETGTAITQGNSAVAAEGHLHCPGQAANR
jgi:FkbM family methyltransferase